MSSQPQPNWRTTLNSFLCPTREFIDNNLRVVRFCTISSFFIVTCLTLRKIKGVRRYTSALDVPKHVYHDVLRVRVATSSMDVVHRPMFGNIFFSIGTFLGSGLGVDEIIRREPYIRTRPYGVELAAAATAVTETNGRDQVMDKDTTAATTIDLWTLQHLVTSKAKVSLVPLFLDTTLSSSSSSSWLNTNQCAMGSRSEVDGESEGVLVVRMHARLAHQHGRKNLFDYNNEIERNRLWFYEKWKMGRRRPTDIGIALVEMGVGRVKREENQHSWHDEEDYMELLEEAEELAKRKRRGVWRHWKEEEEGEEEVSGSGSRSRRGQVTWWQRVFQKVRG